MADANGRLAGKVAIVTGAGSRADGIGNGRATAVLLARHGAQVTLVDQNQAWVERTQHMIEAEGGTSLIVLADVTIPHDCERIVRETVRSWGRLDILVNNVGIGGPQGTAVDVDIEEWDHAMRVNVTSMVLMAKYAIPEMAHHGGGAIVNIASYAGLFGGHPAVSHIEGRRGEHDARHGGAPRRRPHPGECRGAWHGLHADGLLRRHDRRAPRGAQEPLFVESRRRGLGCRQRRAVPGE
jgi:NAD(P)-dependent dehydrogenase (short-subunit alcohol dehydrogenase family)